MNARGWSMDPEDMVENIAGLWKDVDDLQPGEMPSEEEVDALWVKWHSLPESEQRINLEIIAIVLALRDKGAKRALYSLLELDYNEDEEAAG